MKQLVVEKNNPEPILWETPIPKPGPGEILIKNHYSVVSTGTETAAIESANKSVTDKFPFNMPPQATVSSFQRICRNEHFFFSHPLPGDRWSSLLW